ncbi:MAG: ATP-binding protein [Prevotellaceae bacterium]|nr:ATP-binding protein [Prevotellaceae bacterium]
MRFYDRTQEIGSLKEVLLQSRDEGRMTVIMGRRRIGKTELALRCGDETLLYFFVARKTETLLCQDFAQEVEEKLNIPIGGLSKFADMFRFLLRYSEQRPFTLVIDEFQDFQKINPSVFSEMQREWDIHKGKSKMNLIVSGSVFSLMKKIFEDANEPLFGRANKNMSLKPFATSVLKEILADHNPKYTSEDLLALFAITGGVAWYVTLLMDSGRTTKSQMLAYLTEENSPFINEGKNILIEEFGTDYSVHFSILTCIANGQATRGEIEAQLQTDNIGSYLVRLEKYYGLIEKRLPIFAKENSKKTRYVLSDVFLSLWFRFFYKYQAFVENGALNQLARIIERDYNVYSGFVLERYFERKLQESGRYTRIGKYWDRKGENEIDLIAVNEIDNVADIYEIKKNKEKYSESVLQEKVDHLLQQCKEMRGVSLRLHSLALEDM